jgi:hypothetical protein
VNPIVAWWIRLWHERLDLEAQAAAMDACAERWRERADEQNATPKRSVHCWAEAAHCQALADSARRKLEAWS